VVRRFWKPYIGQAVGGGSDLMVGGLQQSTSSNPTRQLLPALYETFRNAQPLHIHPEDGNCNAESWIILNTRYGSSSKTEVTHLPASCFALMPCASLGVYLVAFMVTIRWEGFS
jgi:hypothetical protein